MNGKNKRSFGTFAKSTGEEDVQGRTFMVNDKMCISAGDNKIMCRIDPTIHEEAIKRKGCEAVKMRGREYKGFVYVSEEGIKTKRDLDHWVQLALEYNKRARSSKKKKK